MKNQTLWIVLGTIGFIGLCAFISIVGTFNGLVNAEENVRGRWADVQVALQRRADLVQQLIPVVELATAEERAIFDALVEQARALRGGLPTDEFGNPIIPEGTDMAELQGLLAGFDQALLNFVSYAADNPDFMTGEIYRDFMVQVEGSENRVAVTRRDYNGSVEGYRRSVRSFPNNLIAGMFGFRQDAFPYFQADEGSQDAPDIEFDIDGDTEN